MYIYVDGNQVASGSDSNAIGDSVSVVIGRIYETNSEKSFDGLLDEVRIWDIARSQADIQAYMNRTLDGDESGLVAYYTFDEPAGSTETVLTDTVGGNDGTLMNGPVWITSEASLSKIVAPGNAMGFDGGDDYVALPNEASFDFGDTDFAVELWLKVDSFTKNWQTIISKGDDSWRLSRNGSTNNTLHFALRGLTSVDGSTNVNDGEWHHVAGVADLTNSMLYLYVDSVLDGSTAFTDSLNPSDYEVQIGANAQRSGRNFHGEIDEVRIWNTARSQAEIQANMYNTVGSFETSLVAYYRFEQDSGTELVDVTSFDNDGTLNGSPTWVTSKVPMD